MEIMTVAAHGDAPAPSMGNSSGWPYLAPRHVCILNHVAPCCAMQHHAEQCCTMLCHAAPCGPTLCHTVPCQKAPCCAVQHRAVPSSAALCHALARRAIQNHAVPCRAGSAPPGGPSLPSSGSSSRCSGRCHSARGFQPVDPSVARALR